MADTWSVLTVLAKAALYAGILGALGTAICTAIFRLNRTRVVALYFTAIGLLASAVSFLLKGVALTGDASGLFDQEILTLLWDTQSGDVFVLQMVGLVLLALGVIAGRIGPAVSILGGLIATWSLASIGHVAEAENVALNSVLLLHLICIAYWFGVLPPLFQLVGSHESAERASQIGHDFGRVAMFAVPALILAGIVMSYMLVGSPMAIVTTEYGQTLLVKVAAVGVLLALAALNKIRFVPALRLGDTSAGKRLRQTIIAESAIFACVFVATAYLTTSVVLPN